MTADSRFSRQIAYEKIGAAGQERLRSARVAVIGVGALGTVAANALCRAGVGFLRLVDRDYVELSNLQRQALFDEADAAEGLPKAQAAARHLGAIDSACELEPVVADVTPANVERLVKDVDVVVDGSDNFQLRFLLNEACLKHRVPWVYGAALMDYGVTMNVLPGETACLRCMIREAPPAGSLPTCASAGVINMSTGVIGNIEAAEALKILLGSPSVRRDYLSVSLWDSSFRSVEIERDPDCPVCAHERYEYLGGSRGAYATSLCGRDAVQVSPAEGTVADFAEIARRLAPLGSVRLSEFMLVFSSPAHDIRLFKDGRAIVTKVRDEGEAKSVYAEYIGL